MQQGRKPSLRATSRELTKHASSSSVSLFFLVSSPSFSPTLNIAGLPPIALCSSKSPSFARLFKLSSWPLSSSLHGSDIRHILFSFCESKQATCFEDGSSSEGVLDRHLKLRPPFDGSAFRFAIRSGGCDCQDGVPLPA